MPLRLFHPVIFQVIHQVIPQVWISLILSCHSSLSSIASSWYSRLHPLSIQSCCRYVLVGCPSPAHSCEGVHWRMSLMSSSFLLQLCPTCLVHLIWMVLEMRGRYSYYLVGCCFQDLFNKAHRILMQFPSSFLIYIIAWTQPLLGKNYVVFYWIGIIYIYIYIYISLEYIYIYIYIYIYSRERSSALPYPRCSNYWKESFWVTLYYSHQQQYIHI